MGKQAPELDAVLGAVTRSGERSPLFHWLYQHHTKLAEATRGRRVRWRALCALFAEAGLTDITGKAATERTARETWYRVRREVAKQNALLGAVVAGRPATSQTLPPSRMSLSRRPAIAGSLDVPVSSTAASPSSQAPRRALRMVTSLPDFGAPNAATGTTEDPAAQRPSGMLPRPKWPKPIM